MVRPNALVLPGGDFDSAEHLLDLERLGRLSVDGDGPAGVHEFGENQPAPAWRVGVDHDALGTRFADFRSGLRIRFLPGNAAAAAGEFVKKQRLAKAGP